MGELGGQWNGLLPSISIRDLQFLGGDGEPVLLVGHADISLNLLSSLRSLRLVWGDIHLQNLGLDFVQGEKGRWHIKGMPTSTSSVDANLTIDDPFDIFLVARRVNLSSARLNFSFVDGHHSEIVVPEILLENTEDFHRISLALDVDGQNQALRLVVEGQGDPRNKTQFVSNVWLKLNQLPTSRALSAVASFVGQSTEGEEAQGDVAGAGFIDLEVWASKTKGDVVSWVGSLNAEKMPLGLQSDSAKVERIEADITGWWSPQGAYQLTLQNVSVDEGDGIEAFNLNVDKSNRDAPLQIMASRLDLGAWSKFILDKKILPTNLSDLLKDINPSGGLNHVQMALPLDKPKAWNLKANLDQVKVSAWKGAPAVTQLDGYVEANQSGGFVDIDSQKGFSMHYPLVYEQPLSYEVAKGQVAWTLQPNNNAIYVNSGRLNFSGMDGDAAGFFHLFTPWKKGTAKPEMILQIGLRNSEIKYYDHYVPFTAPESLRNWLKQSLNNGDLLEGGFVYRGSVEKGDVDNRSMQLFLDFENADLNYHPDWPGLTEVKSLLVVDDVDVEAEVYSGKLFESEIARAQVSVKPNPEGKGGFLRVVGDLNGDASDGLRVLLESPIHRAIGSSMDTWAFSGPISTQLDLAVPLVKDEAGLRQSVRVDLQSTQITMNNLRLDAEKLSGQVFYSDKRGLRAKKLSASLWDFPIEVDISSPEVAQGGRRTRVEVAGDVAVGALESWTGLRELSFLEGRSPFELRLDIPSPAESSPHNALLDVRSSLAGISLDLPAPYRKSSEESLPLTLSAKVTGSLIDYDIRLKDRAHGLFHVDDGQLRAATLALGAEALPTEMGTFAINGEVSRIEFGEWLPVFKRYQSLRPETENPDAQAAMRQTLDLAFSEFRYEGFSIDGLDLEGVRAADSWILNLNSQMTAGKLEVFDDSEKPLEFDLAFVRLPASESSEEGVNKDVLADIDLSKFVAFSFATDEFSVGPESYGSWSFHLSPNENAVNLSHIFGSIRGMQVEGGEPGSGATMRWSQAEGQHRSQFLGQVKMGNLSDAMAEWGQPRLLESKRALLDADLSWLGSPANFGLTTMSGLLDVDVEKGRFNRGAGVDGNPLLRLMGLLNFDTLVRRLKLDFSDVVNSGMAYDSIQSKMNFEAGNLYLVEPLSVLTPSSKMQLAGTINLIDETLDASLVATLPVGNNIAFWAAFAAGLPAAAGVYVASKIFEKQIDQLSSLSYSLKGTWAEPELKFQRMFDAKSAKKTGETTADARDEAIKEAEEKSQGELKPPSEL